MLPRGTAGTLAAAVFRNLSHGLYGPERETKADQYSVELCLDAGKEAERTRSSGGSGSTRIAICRCARGGRSRRRISVVGSSSGEVASRVETR
jgi:hypothetical protein